MDKNLFKIITISFALTIQTIPTSVSSSGCTGEQLALCKKQAYNQCYNVWGHAVMAKMQTVGCSIQGAQPTCTVHCLFDSPTTWYANQPPPPSPSAQ